MTRLLIGGMIVSIGGAVLIAQDAVRQPLRRISPAAVAALTPTCKVISDSEVEIQYSDQTTRRVAIPASTPAGGRRVAGAAARTDVAVTRALSASTVTRGFDENGNPYVDEHMPDGSIRRQ